LRNYNVLVQENDKEVIFLHRIAAGNADKSYGIHVARLAGVPEPVLTRAETVLDTLESRHHLPVAHEPQAPLPASRSRAKPQAPEGPTAVEPPEGPKRRRKAEPQPSGPALFGESGETPF
jgi:DNA mismatch repair protein MutS